MIKVEYETNIEEVKKALELADEDKKIIIEDENRMFIACELSRDQVKKLKYRKRKHEGYNNSKCDKTKPDY